MFYVLKSSLLRFFKCYITLKYEYKKAGKINLSFKKSSLFPMLKLCMKMNTNVI